MPDITDLIRRWWKQMLAVVILSVAVIGTITFLKPRKYLSVSTAVPASSFAADKSKIFNENIQALYSTVYLSVTDAFNLFDHYKISEKGPASRVKAAVLLQRNTKVMKSEYGELKVKVWDTDKDLAPQLANAIMDKLQAIHQNLQSAGNEATLSGLVLRKKALELQSDSSSMDKKAVLQNQIQQYENLIGQYQLMVDSKPPVLITVEKAKPASWPDKPKRLQIMVAAGLLSLLFAFLSALLLERSKTNSKQ